MSFGNPAYLKALPLVLLPLLLHLFYPRRRQTVVFAPFMLLTAQQRHPAIRRRLRELLLLLLRMLAIACTILALARPHLKGITFGGENDTGAVILLDDTLSMTRPRSGGGQAFAQAQESALAILEALPPSCRVAVVMVSGAPGMPLSSDREALRQFIATTEATACAGLLPEALEAALRELKPLPLGHRQIFILSDFQANALPENLQTDLEDIPLYGLNLGTRGGNCAIGTVETDGLPKRVGAPFRLTAPIANYSETPRYIHIYLEINGLYIEEKTAALPAGGHADVVFDYTPSTAGELTGRIVIDDGEISLDNAAWFAVDVMEEASVLLVGGNTKGAGAFNYLASALSLLPPQNGGGGFRVTQAVWNDLDGLSLADCNLAALQPDASTPAAFAATVATWLREGGALMLFPPADTTPAENSFCTALAVALGGSPLYKADAAIRNAEAGMELLGPLKTWRSRLELDLIRWQGLRTPASENAEILAANGGGALIAARGVSKGTLLVMGMVPGRSGGNWPELKSYPLMMLTLASYALGNEGRILQVECGQATDIFGEKAQRLLPDGHAVPLAGGRWNGERMPCLTRFRETPMHLAVTYAAPREGDPRCLEDKEVEKRLRQSCIWLEAGRDPAEQIQALQAGTDLTGALLAAALVAIAAEFLIGLAQHAQQRRR